MTFQLHRQLASDCHILGRMTHGWVLLHRNAEVPWLILVPQTDCGDLLDLPHQERDAVISECALLSDFIKDHWRLSKVNFASLGNVVPQMHLHVIGRSPNDSCWPLPVWGNLSGEVVYSPSRIDELRQQLRDYLTGHGEHFSAGPDQRHASGR